MLSILRDYAEGRSGDRRRLRRVDSYGTSENDMTITSSTLFQAAGVAAAGAGLILIALDSSLASEKRSRSGQLAIPD